MWAEQAMEALLNATASVEPFRQFIQPADTRRRQCRAMGAWVDEMGGASVETGSERDMNPQRPVERFGAQPQIQSCRRQAIFGKGLVSIEKRDVCGFRQDG